MLTSLYEKHYPKSIHKIPSKQLLQVKDNLVQSYVDDLHIGASLHDVKSEFIEPIFCHNLAPNFKQMWLIQQAEIITISKALKLLHILDFAGFSIKKFHSTSFKVQNTLN